MTANQAQTVSQAGSTPVPVEASHPAGQETTTLSQYAVDPAAAAIVEEQRNMRIERERKVPYEAPADIPQGLSPNEKVSLIAAGWRPAPPPGEGEGAPPDGESGNDTPSRPGRPGQMPPTWGGDEPGRN